ncbi:MAG: complex I subunit 1 family protein [Phycisphaeraceae bacterium]
MSAQLFVSIVTILVIVNVVLLGIAYLILLERKIASWVQDRIGPNRVGFSFGQEWLPKFHFWGFGQPLADGLKFVLKEDYTPPFVERTLFVLAPIVVMVPAMLGWIIIPWGGWWHFPGLTISGWTIAQPGDVLIAGAAINIGVIYILAIGSMGVYGVVLAGYASNNKYSFLGGLRATAQMLSYEIPLGLAVLIIIMMSGTPRADTILNLQATNFWNLLYQPLLAVIFFTCNLAETNRAPFDLAEAEQELVGGYHTEYSSMKFALFFLAEYAHIITGAAFFTLMFLGGWDIPFVHEPLVAGSGSGGGFGWVLLKIGAYFAKVVLLVSLVMLIRWTLPRFRFDQLMKLAWRSLIPITLALLLATAILEYLVVQEVIDWQTSRWLMLVSNVVVAVAAMLLGQIMPQGPSINRRVALEGSRFSAPPSATAQG